MYKIILSIAIASVFVAHQATSQSESAYQFPADAEAYLDAPLSTTFTCDGQPYGYYADVDNNCKVFHICLPIEDDLGQVIQTAQWSFICGNTTVFDQNTLTCNYAEDSLPCSESPSLYGAVEFGKIPDNK